MRPAGREDELRQCGSPLASRKMTGSPADIDIGGTSPFRCDL
ncbi:MAG: hypothetical protein OJF62_000874 [Pseudolabrys sp.]|nr:hypothetical protein [Pseudolabrys sp.]